MKLNPKVYDTLQWVIRILLPAVAVLYAALSELWSLPKALEVVGTIGAIGLFLGTIMGISSYKYKRDQDVPAGFVWSPGADEDTGIPDIKLVVTQDPSDFMKKDTVTFQVKDPSQS